MFKLLALLVAVSAHGEAKPVGMFTADATFKTKAACEAATPMATAEAVKFFTAKVGVPEGVKIVAQPACLTPDEVKKLQDAQKAMREGHKPQGEGI